MRAARFMKWGGGLVARAVALVAIILGVTTVWYRGVILFVLLYGALLVFGFLAARCPRCGQIWGRTWGWSDVDYDETESFVCRRCRLDIGLAFRK